MELKDLLGESYKEGITVEEITAALAGKTLVDPSTLPKSVNKDVFDRTASELASTKKTLNDLKATTMTSEELLKVEMDKAKQTQTTYAKEIAKLKAREVFVAAGLKEADYTSLLDLVVSDDDQVTLARATSMVTLIAAQKTAAETALRAELLRDTPKPPGGNGKSDPAAELRTKLAAAVKTDDRVRLQMEIHELERKQI